MTNGKSIFRIYMVIVVLLILMTSSGCSVFMATFHPSKKDISLISKGTPRNQLTSEFGPPVSSGQKNNEDFDIFSFKQGSTSRGASMGRAGLYAVADFFSLCIWEVFGTPIEYSLDKKDIDVWIAYNNRDDRINDYFYFATPKGRKRGSSRNPHVNCNDAAKEIAKTISRQLKKLVQDTKHLKIIVGKTDNTPGEIAPLFIKALAKNGLTPVIQDKYLPVAVRSRDQFELKLYQPEYSDNFEPANIMLAVDAKPTGSGDYLLSGFFATLKTIEVINRKSTQKFGAEKYCLIVFTVSIPAQELIR